MSIRLPGAHEAADEPVRVRDLHDYFARAGKPRSDWRVGLELERFAVHANTGSPVRYDEPGGIRDWLAALHAHFGWHAIRNERGFLTALHRDGRSVSLEPGGQFELATSPVATVADAAAELDGHLGELREVVSPNIAFLACGSHPFAHADEIPLMPRVRHEVMAEYLPAKSPTAMDMMKASASVQVALDFADEADAVRKVTTALKLSPIVNALFANGPLYGGRDTGFVSYRGHIWRHMDPDRSGAHLWLKGGAPSFARWIDTLLDKPMMFTCIEGKYRPANGTTFRRWMNTPIDGYVPTLADWQMHLTTVFPEVRLKHFLEVRGADANCRPLTLAVPALWRGLLYDEEALSAAADLADEVPAEDMPELSESAYRHGLHAPYRGRSLAEWCAEIVELAGYGLSRLPGDDAKYLDPAREVLHRGRSPGMMYRAAPPVPTVAARVEWFRFDRPRLPG